MIITLITSETLADFPPMITLLKTLALQKHEINFISPYRDDMWDQLDLPSAEHHYISEKESSWLTAYYPRRITASIAFRFARLFRKMLLNKIPSHFSSVIKNSDIVWILHENTALLGGKRFIKKLDNYLYTMYELCIRDKKVPAIYKYAASGAKLTVVPEYSRAHIAKAYYGLAEMPSVLSNKPIEHPRKRNMPISDSDVAKKVEDLEASGKKIIMYMGILSDERPIEPIVEATCNNEEYIFAVLGARTPYLDTLQKKMGDRFVYLGAVKPPHHLEIASHADIAYVSYTPNNGSINAVFCAPNKVYEFAGFGIPMLCNDNPGLKYTVEHNNMGVCVAELNTESITFALEQIDSNYDAMSCAAISYYDSESVEDAVQKILERYQKIIKDKK